MEALEVGKASSEPAARTPPRKYSTWERQRMKILVTGHLGYIGTVLVPMLLRRGHEVAGMDADWYSRCTFGDPGQIAEVPNMARD
ncbi:MAG TPA: NAD-dependent epimerase/dehydratase family protein, partial [Tepidisphaeraceae bacterium]|nr:NAD-dependent epimerase/dehydratase family protein [Tepidisphaeraceae bacterium]